MKISYYMQKRIRDYIIHFIMLAILVMTLFPIVWMVYASLKENTDILVGKIPLSHAHNNCRQLVVDEKYVWALTSDGGINRMDKKSLKTLKYATHQTTTTHFLMDKDYIWISSANRGLIKVPKENIKKRKRYKLPLPPYDQAKVVATYIVKNNNKIFYTMQYKGYEGFIAFDPKTKGSQAFDVTNIFSPSQVRSLLGVENTLYIGLDKGLLKFDLVEGKITAAYEIARYLPLGVAGMTRFGSQGIILSGNNGAYLFDMKAERVVRKIYSAAVQTLKVFGSRVYIGTNRGYKVFDLASDKTVNHEMLFREVKRDGTVIKNSPLTYAEVSALTKDSSNVYLGSSYGRISKYNQGASRVIKTSSTRQGHLVISWVNYYDMWKNVDFGLYLRNSFIICGISTIFAMIFATLTAYAVSRFDFPGSRLFSIGILATQMVPMIMFLIPIYSNFVKITEFTGIPIKGTFYGMIFVYSGFFIPFSIWILRGFFAAIPIDLEEAARIDGCSPIQVFWFIVLPLAVPGIIATGIYIFLTAWDELIFAWVLTSANTMTIPVGIRNFVGNYQNRFDLIMAAATVATLPVMILFFMLQKYIVKGLTAGAVKG